MAKLTDNVSDAIEWELRASDGTVIKLVDVVFENDVVEIPDSDDPQAVRREYVGTMNIKGVAVYGCQDEGEHD